MQEEQPLYFAATFSSAFFGFVDDVEVRIDPQQALIHLRSASRIGYSDFGANRKRLDQLKKAIEHELNAPL